MGKYSSGSESERWSRSSYKNRSKRRSSSSSSSDSRTKTHKRKNDKRRHSRSRRSHSSSSRSKSHRNSHSKERSHSKVHYRPESNLEYRSRSRSHIKEYVAKSRRRSSSSSSDSELKRENSNESIKKEVKSTLEISQIDSKVFDAINEDSFTPKSFTSSKSKKVLDNIVIDLKKQTIKIPEVEPVEPDSIFHHNLFLNEEARMEKWIKELYSYRQKALQQGLKGGDK